MEEKLYKNGRSINYVAHLVRYWTQKDPLFSPYGAEKNKNLKGEKKNALFYLYKMRLYGEYGGE